jgi:hypothetical protein
MAQPGPLDSAFSRRGHEKKRKLMKYSTDIVDATQQAPAVALYIELRMVDTFRDKRNQSLVESCRTG